MKFRHLRSTLRTTVQNQRGVTLFEILIVVGIIGGLLAVLIPKVLANRNQAKVQETRIRMSDVIQNLTLYQNDCQKFPGSLDALVKNDGCANWNGPYTKSEPKDAWGSPFVYESDGNNFKLKSLGADRKEGGDGFNRDIDSEDLQ